MDQERPNQNANKEPAEGSRETVTEGGITNRPLEREEQEQRQVPSRGKTKEEERQDPVMPADDATLNTKI